MSAILVVNGRVALVSNPSRYPVPRETHASGDAPLLPGLAARRAPSRPLPGRGEVWADAHGLNHQVSDAPLAPSAGWQTLAVTAGWYGVSEVVARGWAAQGLLACAVERGSQVGFYRVLDPVRLRAEAGKLRAAAVARPLRRGG